MTTAPLAFEIVERPEYSIVVLRLAAGQRVHTEPGAMAWMSPTIRLKAGFAAGFKRSIGRAFGGESVIRSTYVAEAGGEIAVAAGQPGDTVHYPLRGSDLVLQRGAYLASGDGVDLSASWQGARGFFGGQGLVMLKASGHGDLFFQTFGAVLEIDVRDDYVVDSGYVVAFEATLAYRVTTLPGLTTGRRLKSLLFGGEGLVTRFSGEGRLWIQTRAIMPWLAWLEPFRPVQHTTRSEE